MPCSKRDLIINYYLNLDYEEVRYVEARGFCGLFKMALTWALIIHLNGLCYGGRYCYEHRAAASKALKEWDGKGDPIGPWIKYKGEVERCGPGMPDKF